MVCQCFVILRSTGSGTASRRLNSMPWSKSTCLIQNYSGDGGGRVPYRLPFLLPLPLPVQRAGGYAAHCKIRHAPRPTAVARPYLMTLAGPSPPAPESSLPWGTPSENAPRSLFFPISSRLFNLRPSSPSWLFLLSIDVWPLPPSASAASLSSRQSASTPLAGSQMPLDDTRPSMVN